MDSQPAIPDRAARSGWSAASALLALVVLVAAAPGLEASALRRDPAPHRLTVRFAGLPTVWRVGRVVGAGPGLASRPLPESGATAALDTGRPEAGPPLIRESLLNLPPPGLA